MRNREGNTNSALLEIVLTSVDDFPFPSSNHRFDDLTRSLMFNILATASNTRNSF